MAALALLAWCTALPAADANGQFAVKGFGLGTCEQFVQARNDQSRDYFQFGGWLNGYLSATNRYESQTFDIAPWQATGLLAEWLSRYCQSNPELPFVQAVAKMVNLLGKDRITTLSERVTAGDGERPLYIYRSVLRQVQQRLTERGFYQGDINGDFDAATREALERFQADQDLSRTGLPDQATLAKLLG